MDTVMKCQESGYGKALQDHRSDPRTLDEFRIPVLESFGRAVFSSRLPNLHYHLGTGNARNG